MSTSTKILLAIVTILALSGLTFIIYKQHEIATMQNNINTQMISQKELVDNIMRSQSTWATKDDIDKFITSNGVNLKAIQDDISSLHAEITAANSITVDSSGQHKVNLPSSGVGTTNPHPTLTCQNGVCPDPYNYLTKQQNLNIFEDFTNTKVPIGSVGFSAWQQAPWSLNISPREYHVTSVIATDENKQISVYNKFSVNVNNKEYDLTIKNATTQQQYPTAKFTGWNPRLFLAINGGIGVRPIQGEFTPSINFATSSYGKYLNTPDFSLIQVGVGFGTVSRKVQFLLSPGAYNIGQQLPFMHNLYLGPSIAVGTDGNVLVMGGLSVGL